MSRRSTIFDHEVRSQTDRQVRVLRDILKEQLPPGHENNAVLDKLLPKEHYSSEEQVMETFFNLKLPDKSVIEVEKENTQYLQHIAENHARQRYISQAQNIPAPPEPPILSMRQIKCTPTYSEEGCKMYSHIKEEHIKVVYNKEITRGLFHRELNSTEDTNIYSLTISILRRCETLGMNQPQIGSAMIITCSEIMQNFKSTLLSLACQGSRVMLKSFLSQTSEKAEMNKCFNKLKALKRTPSGEPKIQDLITSLRIQYHNFLSIKKPQGKDMKDNLQKAEERIQYLLTSFYDIKRVAT